MPTVDQLARDGILFTQARAPAPYCSPARASLISGSFATTYGTDHHRQQRAVPHEEYYFPRLLREAGYFTTNNSKTDYNARNWRQYRDRVWDEQGDHGTYNSSDRMPGQPFFSVFNQMSTHMGRLRSFHTDERRPFVGYEPHSVELPPYIPDLPEIRSDYSFMLEAVDDLDNWVRLFVDDLEQRGLRDDTIIFFFADHGGNMPRAKGYPFDTGYLTPFILWVPEKWAHLIDKPLGRHSDRLVGFEDFGPTVLELAGLKIPEHMQGRDFLTPGSEDKPYQFLFRTNHGWHYDPAHSVTNGRHKYIRFYRPHKPLGLRQSYQWGLPSYQAWDRAYRRDSESLSPEHARWFHPTASEYLVDLHQDPWQISDNLADDSEYRELLERMREALDTHLRETRSLSFFPFHMRTPDGADTPLCQWVRESDYPLQALHDAARIASLGKPEYSSHLVELLESSYPEIRSWAASGLTTLAQRGKIDHAPDALINAARTDHAHTAITAAEALCYLGETELGLEVLYSYMNDNRPMIAGAATSSLESIGKLAKPLAKRLWKNENQWRSRSVLINIGEMDFDELHRGVYEQGLEVNRHRRDWSTPEPNP